MTGQEADPIEGMTPIDPRDYPHRCTLLRENPAPDSNVAIVWLPWPLDMTDAVLQNFADGGGVVLMARTAGELVRMRELVELIIAPAPVRSGDSQHRTQ